MTMAPPTSALSTPPETDTDKCDRAPPRKFEFLQIRRVGLTGLRDDHYDHPENPRLSAVSRMFDDDASVTRLYLELREGREEAATDLWQLCCRALVREARKQLGSNERRVSDEEDVALAVFHELCQGVRDGRLGDDLRREDLTKLLRHFTRQETLDQRRHAQRAKRGGGTVRGDSVFAMGTDGMQAFIPFPARNPLRN